MALFRHDWALALVLCSLKDLQSQCPAGVPRAYCCTAKVCIEANCGPVGSGVSSQAGLGMAEDQGGCKE